MHLLDSIPVTAFGLLVALGCVAAGAPMFLSGRRALRMRSVFGSLVERPLAQDAAGWVQVSGRVALVSPLFAPLSGTRCAGFRLEVCGVSSRVGGVVSEQRPFRLDSGERSAQVAPDRAEWQLPVTAERTVGTNDALPERLAQLLESNAEIRWLRDRRVPLRIVERALTSGANVTVLGVAREEWVESREEHVELAATGTDDGVSTTITSGDTISTGELWLVGDDVAGIGPRVFTSQADPRTLMPAPWRLALLGAGPALALAGLLYLVRAAGPLVTGRV